MNELNLLNNSQIILQNSHIKKDEGINNLNGQADNPTFSFDQLKDKFDSILSKIQQEVKEIKGLNVKELEEKLRGYSAKNIGMILLGAVLGGALAYFTFGISLIPVSFLIQLLFTGSVSVKIPEQILQFLQLLLGIGILGSQYSTILGGAIAGGTTTNQMLKNSDYTKIDTTKIAQDDFKNSQSFIEYVRNGFNLGVEWAKETNRKAGGWTSIPLAFAVSASMMAPLALLVASLAIGYVGFWPSIAIGTLLSLPIGVKVFKAVKDFAKEIYGLVGGAIGGAVGTVIGGISKVLSTVKGWFGKESKKTDEFQSNSPYKNIGMENLFDSAGKVSENFLKGSADVISFTSLINNILTKEPSGLGTIASIIGGTVKSFEGASILKNAAIDNKPQNFKVGLFRFLSGFSMLLSFLGPLLGPWGIVGFSVASLLFMGLEKFFQVKNSLTDSKQDIKDNQNVLKNSYAIGVAGGQFVDSLGSLGKFWMGWDSIFGGQYGGLTSVFGLVGSTRDILQGSKMMQMAKERNNVGLGIQGLLNVVGGVSLALAALGMGRIFGIASIAIEVAKLIIQVYSMTKNSRDISSLKTKFNDLFGKILDKFSINKNESELKIATANTGR